MAVDSDLILSAALEYASYGWRVVPLHEVLDSGACSCKKGGECTSTGKHPRLAGWEKSASCDEDTINGWWVEWPYANVGIRLGASSGIIDFEGDGPDAEKTLTKMFGELVPATPTFVSSRGKHRLFKYRDDLPGQGKNGFKVGDLEIRTGYGDLASQSVFPPSQHPSGAKYKWLLTPSECPVAEIPNAVQAWLWNYFGDDVNSLGTNTRNKKDWKKIQSGVAEGGRNEALAAFAGKLIADMGDPFDNGACGRQLDLLLAWNDRNKPPMDHEEVSSTFNSILARHRQQLASSTANNHFEKDRPASAPSDWRLEIIESQPRKYRLYAPLWANKTRGGYIDIEGEGIMSPAKIRHAAMAQADVWVDSNRFDKHWLGAKGIPSLGKQLTDTAAVLPAEPEERRDVVVAEMVLSCLERARVAVDDAGPDHRGRPVRMADGAIWFQVSAILEDVGYTLAKIKQAEIVECLKNIGATTKAARVGGSIRRFKVIDRISMRNLTVLAQEHHEAGGDEATKNVAPM